jgi:hypothetical protein
VSSKLRIKCGEIELDYEGDLTFEKADLLGLAERLSTLNNMVAKPSIESNVKTGAAAATSLSAPSNVGSVSDIARKLGVATGPDLIKAAAAALYFGGKADFTSREITASMREAKHFFKPSYTSNQGVALERLVKKGILRSLGGDRYTLSHETIEDLKKALA